MQVIVNNIINGFVYEFLLFTLNIFSQESCLKWNFQKMNCWQCNIMGTSTSWNNSLWGPLHGGYLDEWMLFYWSGDFNILGTFTSVVWSMPFTFLTSIYKTFLIVQFYSLINTENVARKGILILVMRWCLRFPLIYLEYFPAWMLPKMKL